MLWKTVFETSQWIPMLFYRTEQFKNILHLKDGNSLYFFFLFLSLWLSFFFLSKLLEDLLWSEIWS